MCIGIYAFSSHMLLNNAGNKYLPMFMLSAPASLCEYHQLNLDTNGRDNEVKRKVNYYRLNI